MSRIFLPFILIFHLFSSPTPNLSRNMADKIQPSLVHLTGVAFNLEVGQDAPFTCTGFVVGPQLVLTAKHCVMGGALAVNQVAARVVRTSTDYLDLALVTSPFEKPIIKLGTTPNVGDELIALGYAFGAEFPRTVIGVVIVAEQTPDPEQMAPGLFIAGQYMPGMSGGPVVDHEGRVVGIVQQSQSGIGYGVGVDTIRAFLFTTTVIH